jgi:hypothetical protein
MATSFLLLNCEGNIFNFTSPLKLLFIMSCNIGYLALGVRCTSSVWRSVMFCYILCKTPITSRPVRIISIRGFMEEPG